MCEVDKITPIYLESISSILSIVKKGFFTIFAQLDILLLVRKKGELLYVPFMGKDI